MPENVEAGLPSVQRGAFKVLGVRVHAVQITDVVTQVERWIEEGDYGHVVATANAHIVMECRRNPQMMEAINSADLVIPDGMPIVWLGRKHGFPLKERAYGPDVMEAILDFSVEKGYSHYFYGSTPETLKALVTRIRQRWPRIRIAGWYSPPFRPLTPEEDEAIVQMLNKVQPDILWVGLGCPKQELWIHSHKNRLKIPVLLGVGAAFDFLSGRKLQAPKWMRQNGLEWLFRFLTNPRRIWYRVLILGPQFVFLVMLENLGLKKFD